MRSWKKKLSMGVAAAVAITSAAVPAWAAEEAPLVESVAIEDLAPADVELVPEEIVGSGEMVYGTVDINYADFYYGELNDLAASTETIPQLNVADPVKAAGYEEEGMYDAVTSATKTKASRYTNEYQVTYGYEDENAVYLEGVNDVQIAVPKALYDNAKNAIEQDLACSNDLLKYVEAMTVSETPFTEYKVLNADGTFSKMVTEVEECGSAAITTTSVWGNYQVSMADIDVEANELIGGVLEVTDVNGDVEKIGLKHLDNLWFRTNEIAFAIKEFKEPHGNMVQYQRFADIEGKRITKITYMVKNYPDIVINTDLLCKTLLTEGQSGTSEAGSYNVQGTTIPVTLNVPADAAYELKSVTGPEGVCNPSKYSYANNVLTLDASCHPGAYTLGLEDAKYEDMSVGAVVKSNMDASAIAIKFNKLSVTDEVSSLAEYVAQISSVTVNGKKIENSGGLGAAIFGTEGMIDFAAQLSKRGNVTVIFPEGAEGNYELTVEATGFPTVTTNVGASYKEKKATTITAKNVTKTFGAAVFSLNAKSTGGALSYKSSNKKVVTVSAAGKVTIKGTGKATITITAKETDENKAATKKITVTVQPKKQAVSVKSTAKKKAVVTWKKNTTATGYQVVIATNSKFTKNVKKYNVKTYKTVQKTISGLTSGKTYYVKVRSYKTSGSHIFGAYSATKTVKVK